MARYRTNAGVVVNIDEDRAARIPGLTPVKGGDDKPQRSAAAPRKAAPRKATKATSKTKE